ncbi:MAG: histidinol dehydrogenase [Oscillospiraceae bacterium]|nr:histidinol dehydrogenase [Oscillospiraceae bacterium]
MIKIVKPGESYIADRANTSSSSAISAAVAEIIAGVISRGDAALREYTEKFDGLTLENFEKPPSALDAAIREVGSEFVGIMERAAKNIEDFHKRQIREGFIIKQDGGVILGQRIVPLQRVGLYIPGGTAAYPSSVLMNCIPAKLAGVSEIIMTTPPSRSGRDDAGILAAAKIAGVDRVFTIGGAQAIAALAYGTQTIPRVDKITGPGNAYVAEAKRQVFGVVGIDMIAGPSDILVIADETANSILVAADMLSQCEHGEDSAAVLITDSPELAEKVSREIETQLQALPRQTIARGAVEGNSKIIIAESLDKAFEISNELAPEHLEIFLDDPFAYLEKAKNAGSIFLGKNTPEALGDYYAGPNHTLPTSGTSRFSSPLSVDDFVKKSSFTYYTDEALMSASGDVADFAKKEGLMAHALSVLKRDSNRKQPSGVGKQTGEREGDREQ